ncbi:MAG: hypothetical protein A2138_09350 [Deltaproteobacteria bacterium RBG_16_71_12]|nr:MAG: hypothetical protein A2138_09350 [Deltaproteobacteria bacterium RBG_16_71_12]
MRSSFLLLLSLVAAPCALAYPSMIAHGYTSCAACHVDPSGSGQLTAYGRGMSDLLVRWHLDPLEVESGEPSPTAGFLFGLVPTPEWLNPSGNLRGGGMVVVVGSDVAVVPLIMATDVTATLDLSPVVAHVALGFGLKNMGPAVVISPDPSTGELALVSREHWLGLKLLDDSLYLRAGRMPVPFGLRNVEHTAAVRDLTRTDVNVDQQHGVAVAWANDVLRTEVMGLVGNFQIRPDAVRERGLAGYLEVFPIERLGVGASSLATWAQRDLDTGVPLLRQAHGLFARFAPVESLAVLVEADTLIDTAFGAGGTTTGTVGGAGWLQADWTIVPGVHLMPAVEGSAHGDAKAAGWLAAAWYPLPHTELRADAIYRQAFAAGGTTTGTFVGLAQLHLFL